MSDEDTAAVGSLPRYMEHVPTAFAIARGPEYSLVYANGSFRRLSPTSGDLRLGQPIVEAFGRRDATEIVAILDHVWSTGLIARDRRVRLNGSSSPWCCTVWPAPSPNGAPEHLVVELRAEALTDPTLTFQRDVAERMLLSALTERDVATDARASSRRANFLAAEGRRLAESLDEETTLQSMASLTMPQAAAWCIVDLVHADGSMHRLAIVHPDPVKRALLHELQGRWMPEPGDTFGAPAVLRGVRSIVVHDVDQALAAAVHDADMLRVLREVGFGTLLTVPLLVHERLVGALTFVSAHPEQVYAPADIALAEELASRSALALDSARLHSEAVGLRREAEAASQAKSAFLGTMSHELRTPLNAIGGYVELIDMGLRGPVTEAQHRDLARIRRSQQHLMVLVSDILNFVRIGSGRLQYDIADLVIAQMLETTLELVDSLLTEKQIVLDVLPCDASIVASADREKTMQILVNLLSNAVKFTATGGRIHVACRATEDVVQVSVADTGIGIAPDKFEVIFEPFVQVRAGLAGRDSGVGLGLAISRQLARGMNGDVDVESTLGAGSRFTLNLPRSHGASQEPPPLDEAPMP